MNINFDMSKDFCSVKDVAKVIWENLLLAEELGFRMQVRKIGDQEIIPKPMTVEFITDKVCDYFNVPAEMLKSTTRKREIVQARQISMFFSKNLTKYSLAIIGSQIGDKDHATVLHACKVINNLRDTDKHFKAQIDEIEKRLK